MPNRTPMTRATPPVRAIICHEMKGAKGVIRETRKARM